jgi:hypothetical protein
MGYGFRPFNKINFRPPIAGNSRKIYPRDPLPPLRRQGRVYKILGYGHIPIDNELRVEYDGSKIDCCQSIRRSYRRWGIG